MFSMGLETETFIHTYKKMKPSFNTLSKLKILFQNKKSNVIFTPREWPFIKEIR